MNIREYMQSHPAIGWVAAALLGAVAVLTFARNIGGGETAELSQMVTIRCRETQHEWKLPRGAMEKQLMERTYPVSPDEGLVNPETGKPTGFPVDDWQQTVQRVNALRKPLAEKNAAKQPAK